MRRRDVGWYRFGVVRGSRRFLGTVEENLAVLCALQLTPDMPREGNTREQEIHSKVQTFLTPRQPRIVIVGCGAGRALLEVEGSSEVAAAIDPDSKSPGCIRSNTRKGDAGFVRTSSASGACWCAVNGARP